jgi:hypothetical protein
MVIQNTTKPSFINAWYFTRIFWALLSASEVEVVRNPENAKLILPGSIREEGEEREEKSRAKRGGGGWVREAVTATRENNWFQCCSASRDIGTKITL